MAGESKIPTTQDELDALIAERLAAEVDGLKKNQAEALKEAKAAKARLAAFDGVDPEEFKRLKQASEDAERKRLAGEGDFKALEQQLIKKYESEIEKERGVSSRYRGSLEEYLIDAEAMRELAQHSDSPGLLLPHVKSRMKVVEQDGRFTARIVDDHGNVRIGKGQGSAPMTLSELMDEMKQDKTFAPAFRGSGSSGGGASRSSGGAGGARTIAANDADAFLANLKEIAAGKIEVG